MADNFKAAKEEIARMARAYKAFEEADNALAVIEGYDQNVKELTGAIENSKAELADSQLQVTKGKKALADLKVQGEDIIAQAQAKAENLINDATKDALKKTGDAQKALDALNNKRAAVQASVDALILKSEQAQADLDKVTAAVGQHKAALAGALSTLE